MCYGPPPVKCYFPDIFEMNDYLKWKQFQHDLSMENTTKRWCLNANLWWGSFTWYVSTNSRKRGAKVAYRCLSYWCTCLRWSVLEFLGRGILFTFVSLEKTSVNTKDTWNMRAVGAISSHYPPLTGERGQDFLTWVNIFISQQRYQWHGNKIVSSRPVHKFCPLASFLCQRPSPTLCYNEYKTS